MKKLWIVIAFSTLLTGCQTTIPQGSAPQDVSTNASGINLECKKQIDILENILNAEEVQFKGDRCQLVKAGAATRKAMLSEISKYPNSCGFPANLLDDIQRQSTEFSQQALTCSANPPSKPVISSNPAAAPSNLACVDRAQCIVRETECFNRIEMSTRNEVGVERATSVARGHAQCNNEWRACNANAPQQCQR